MPSAAKWRLDNVDDSHIPVEVIAWTVLGSLASVMAVSVPGTSNAVTDQDAVFEARKFTVMINEGLGTQSTQDKYYRVKNLVGVS